MKISGKVLLIIIYILVISLGTYQLQNNPSFIKFIDEYVTLLRDYGIVGMLAYAFMSATFTVLAIPLQFLDLVLGIVYTVQEATLILIISKMMGAGMTFYAANYLISEQTRQSYMTSKYLKGLQELVRREPLKYGLLLRFASIPIIVRNYGLALLPINFSTYMTVTFIQSAVTSPFQAFTASQFSSFMDFVNQNNVPIDEDNMFDEDGNFIPQQKAGKVSSGSVFMLLGGLCIMIFVGSKVKKAVDKINSESELKEQLQEQTEKKTQ
ncbi:UNKNOWN [Stylonychia lemnae]|uniref:VTT domain-containing protein n=1 Tax=Stylonychia lemnae TaxID=5949 RepID=A0A078AWY9_STYLE|nr:UNKNOWN [Stylonychia lemnae]|eukprot:CDW86576.1 UNKNOWN [Stylonychia lemnae]